MNRQRTTSYLLRGGLNTATPAIAVPPGEAIGASNFESDVRGYARVAGFERFDGRPRPSEATYHVLRFDAGAAAITTGETVSGAASGATATAVIDAVIESGAYGSSDAAGYLVLSEMSGAFIDNEMLQVSGITRATANGTPGIRGALNDVDDQTWISAVTSNRRALINQVPGSGPVRGVCTLNGELFAIRDNAGATAGILHKATPAGWVALDLGHIIEFAAGATAFVIGEVVTGETSGATATIQRVVVTEGAWNETAKGFLVISGITGTFQAETIDGGTSSGSATCEGAETANQLPAGGHYDFVVHNFFGTLFQPRMYAVNGVGRAFEWDGTTFTPIRTGLPESLDKPMRVSMLSKHLFLWFAGGEITHSEIGEPVQYQTTGGAGSFSFGSDPADMLEPTATALVLIGTDRTGYIAGTDATNFALNYISEDTGGRAWTGQVAGNPVYMDDAGVRDLSTTQAFGNWRLGTITEKVEPFFRGLRANGVEPTASVRVKNKDLYRVFFSDQSVLSIYFGRENPESMILDLPFQAFCARAGKINGEGYDGVFVGTEDGWVHEMDRGTSFDGDSIFAFIRLAFNAIGSPTRNKRFHKITLECDLEVGASLAVLADPAYGSAEYPAVGEQQFEVAGGGGFWNATKWNEFFWSAQVAGQAEAHIDAIGQNLSVVIASDTATEQAPVLSSTTLNYSNRGLIR